MSILLKNCTLITGTGSDPVPDAWVLVAGGTIERIGNRQAPPPAADTVIDGADCTLLPGLINLHVHIQRRHLSLHSGKGTFKEGAPAVENSSDIRRMLLAVKNAWRELACGVTTIRDCSSKNRINIALRNALREGIINGPSVLACGFGIACTGGHETHKYQGAVEADGPDEIRKAVRTEIRAGADFVKFMGSGGIGGMPEDEDPDWVELGEEELAAGIREAHRRGRRTTVHAMGRESILNALRAGIDCIEHGCNLDEEALDRMIEKNVYYVPTISGIVAVADREWESGKKQTAELIRNRVVAPLTESIRRARERGIIIGAGTDTLGDMVDELRLLHACGLSTMECLLAATGNATRICGLSGSVGTVEPGKIADLMMVRGNPLHNLDALRHVKAVIRAGRLVDSAFMIAEDAAI